MRDISNHHSKHSKDSSNTSTDNCNCDMILPINSHQLHHSNSFNFNNYSNFSFSSLDHFLMSNALSPDQNHQTLSNKKRKKLSAEESFNLPYPSLSKEFESADAGLSTENIVSGGKTNGVNGYNLYGSRKGEKLKFNQNLAQVQPTENYAEKLELPELNRQGSEMSDYKPLNLRAQYSIGSEFAEYQPFNQRFNSLKQENNDNVHHERKQQDVYDVNGEQGKQKTQVIPIENWTLSSEVSKPNKPHIGKHFNLEQLQSQKQIYHKESAEANVIASNNPHKTRRTSQMTNASSKNSNADLENQTANVEFEPTHVQMTGPKAKSRLNPIKNSASKLKKLGFTSSEYNGVCWNKRKEKWRARFNYNGKREFLGDFDTQEEAAHAFDKRIREVYPKSKQLERLNFIDGKRNVPNPSI